MLAVPKITAGGGDFTSTLENTMPYLQEFMLALGQWPQNYEVPSILVPLAVTLSEACKIRPCPANVLTALNAAIATHNVDPATGLSPRYGRGSEAPDLPTSETLALSFYNDLKQSSLKPVMPFLDLSQPRICMAHGCLQANSEKIIKIQLADQIPSSKRYVLVGTQDVTDSYKIRGSTKTLHWLWRLQSGAGADEETYDGIMFDLFTVGKTSMRVTVETKQAYEPMFVFWGWFLFAIRFVIFVAFDAIACSIAIQCQQGDDEDHAVEITFLECAPSKTTYFILLLLFVLDFANILNPLFNVTAVQQGEFLWAAKNAMIVDMLGYTGCKLELATVPATITVLGRMLTGDDDTSMEVFLYQMGVFVMPLILGKAGYNFVINTSTLCLLYTTFTVAVRLFLRYRDNKNCFDIMCSDDNLERLREKSETPLLVALGFDAGVSVHHQGCISWARHSWMAISRPIKEINEFLVQPTKISSDDDTNQTNPLHDDDHDDDDAMPRYVEDDASSQKEHCVDDNDSDWQMTAKVDNAAVYAMLLPIVVCAIVQFWSIFGSTTHPITMPGNVESISAAIAQVAQLSIGTSSLAPNQSFIIHNITCLN